MQNRGIIGIKKKNAKDFYFFFKIDILRGYFIIQYPMIFSEEYLSESDKIDHIYRMLRTERRLRIFKLIFKLAILGFIVYGYFYITDPAHEEIRAKITSTVQTKLMELILPIVGNMVENMTENMQVPMNQTLTSSTSATTNTRRRNIPSAPTINITPEMIRAVQDGMKK